MIAWLDCSSGISGDKFLASLLDAGEADGRFTVETVADAMRDLGVPELTFETRRVVRGGVAGLHLQVGVTGEPLHRSWSSIREMLAGSALPAGARSRAITAFEALAVAEARIHGVSPEDVHFHEVGASDSIADIVGVSLGLEALGIRQLVCSPLALGSGHITGAAHGTLPVPAPATLELLHGIPVESGVPAEAAPPGELTTPTGAALVVANATAFGPMPRMVPSRLGYGAGTRDIPGVANVSRLVLGDSLDLAEPGAETDEAAAGPDTREDVVLLETAVDHIAPEQVAFSAEELREHGALDVWQVPAAMKKGRLGIELRVLVRPEDADRLASLVHDLTGSLGVRRTAMTRTVLDRTISEFEGPWGAFSVKTADTGRGQVSRPEHEDIARIARTTGMPYGEVARRLREIAAEDPDTQA